MGGRGTPAYTKVQQFVLEKYIAEQTEVAEIEKIKMIRDSYEIGGAGTGGASGSRGYRRCACCDNFSIPVGTKGEECSICGWIDDEYQNTHPDSLNGENVISLREARENYKKRHKNNKSEDIK